MSNEFEAHVLFSLKRLEYIIESLWISQLTFEKQVLSLLAPEQKWDTQIDPNRIKRISNQMMILRQKLEAFSEK